MTDEVIIRARLPWLGYPTFIYDVKDLTVKEFAVFVVLWSYATRDGEKCFPSMQTIANQARVSKRTAQRAVRVLEELGLVKAHANPSGRTYTYELSTVGSSTGVTQSPQWVSHSHPRGVTQSPDEMPVMGCHSSSDDDDQSLDTINGVTRSEWNAWWNDTARCLPLTCGQGPWPRVSVNAHLWANIAECFDEVKDLYPSLKVAISTRLAQPIDGYMLNRGWFGLRWLMSDPENLAKFLEGAYTDKKELARLKAEIARKKKRAAAKARAEAESKGSVTFAEYKRLEAADE